MVTPIVILVFENPKKLHGSASAHPTPGPSESDGGDDNTVQTGDERQVLLPRGADQAALHDITIYTHLISTILYKSHQ